MLRLIRAFCVLVLFAAACQPVPASPSPLVPTAIDTAAPTATSATRLPAPAPTNTTAALPTAAATNTTTSPTGAATRPSATPARAGSGSPTAAAAASPAVQGQDCGRVMMLGPNPPRDPSALQAENCFWQAYQECRAATLVVQQQSVDTGTTSTFTLQKKDRCIITDTEQTSFAARPPLPANVYTCSALVRKDGGLLFQACGRAGDILVPAPQTS